MPHRDAEHCSSVSGHDEQCGIDGKRERVHECLLICRAIKRVKGSRWAASAPSVSANELTKFTA